ncbi:MAG TPA: CotH kinase family protein [Saprospiraceae bacterium]|nr:CotH kinase family protein [Saprospiraceae bacterium]HMQ82808.1 CotH kinase family protein [Saprospiraceae bacterium]
MKTIFTIVICCCISTTLLSQAPPVEAPPPVELAFSEEGGFYLDAVSIQLYSPEASIYYTTDGSDPGKNTTRYRNAIQISETTVLKAIAILPNGGRSPIIGHTYFINEPLTEFPVVSIGINPGVLFHPSKGLFMLGGNVVDTLWKKPGANFWSKKEVTNHVELFESDGRCVYRSMSGLRLFGGMSRLFPQKSLTLVARKPYGEKRFRYPLFGEEGLDKFKFLVLRNSGSDFGKTHFRDGLMTSLVADWNLDMQDFRPAQVYINGQYWGIYNIREKVNKYFIADHHDVNKDSIDLIEHHLTLKQGSKKHYLRMLDFLEKNDLSDDANMAYLSTQMDIDNFKQLQIAQIYFDNQDAGGNIKFWRPQTPDGRWRWILFDTDWGFGLHDPKAYLNNSLEFHTAANGPSWPNPPWSTFILRKLLENEEFERDFVNHFADCLNTSFHPNRVQQQIDSFYQMFLPEIPRHLERWKLSREKWELEVSHLHRFAQERPAYVRMHLMNKFDTGPQRKLIAGTNPGGRLILNNHVAISQDTLTGIYFQNYPITLKAVAHQGYQFSHWAGIDMDEQLRDLTLKLDQPETTVYAVFEPFRHPLEGKLVINEICPRGNSGDWLELYNNSKHKVLLKGWSLSDQDGNEFVLPEASIDPGDYLIICQDEKTFLETHPTAYNILGGLPFGLHKRKDQLALYSILGAMVDSVAYEILPIDSAYTLSLLLPNVDNSDQENWEIRLGDGSPSAANPYYLESTVKQVQQHWVQFGLSAGVFLLSGFLLFLRLRGKL